MHVQTMRFRFDRKTGVELSRTVLNDYEIDDDTLGEMLVIARTGKTLDEVSKDLMAWTPPQLSPQTNNNTELQTIKDCSPVPRKLTSTNIIHGKEQFYHAKSHSFTSSGLST